MEEKNQYTEQQQYALASVEKIKKMIVDNNNNYIHLGLLLHEANTYYKNIPFKTYKDIYEFAKDEFDLCKTSVKYLIGINRRFAKGMTLKDKFKEYNYTQLREMLPLTDAQLDLVNPKMSAAEIKALRKVHNIDEDSILNKHIKTENTAYEEVYFKNDTERAAFLSDYTKWELFKEVPELTLRFFRVQLTDKTYIIATEYEYHTYKDKFEKSVIRCLINPQDKNSRYSPSNDTHSTLVDHLRTNKLGYYRLVQND